MLGDVARGDLERIRRHVRGGHVGVGEGIRRQQCETARARAEVEHRAHTVGAGRNVVRIAGERGQQLGDEGARNEHAAVDEEGALREDGRLREIGRRNALQNARAEQVEHLGNLARREARVGERLEHRRRQARGVRDEKNGLLVRVGRAVPEKGGRLGQTRRAEANQIAQRATRLFGLGGQQTQARGRFGRGRVGCTGGRCGRCGRCCCWG